MSAGLEMQRQFMQTYAPTRPDLSQWPGLHGHCMRFGPSWTWCWPWASDAYWLKTPDARDAHHEVGATVAFWFRS